VRQVHKHNSNEHLRPNRFGARPTTAAHRTYTSAAAKVRPKTAYARLPSVHAGKNKSQLQKAIDGDTGPPMTGVTTYPFSRSQRYYVEDFQSLVAMSITHPFTVTTNPTGSVPHNLVSGAPRASARARLPAASPRIAP